MSKRFKVLVIQGANMSYLGRREPEVYGTTTAAEVDAMLRDDAARQGADLDIVYTHVEGEAITRVYAAVEEGCDGLLMNPAGFQYAGFALRDCLKAVAPVLPYVEVHVSKNSITGGLKTVTADAAQGMMCGFGVDSYRLGLDALLRIVEARRRRAA